MFGWYDTQASSSVAEPDCVYAVGDIHGRSDLLEQLLGMIRRDAARWAGRACLVFIGDYIDRGRDSRGVIDILLELQSAVPAYFLRGNHDQALLDFVSNPASYREWRNFGADETLISYSVPPPASDDLAVLHETRALFARLLPLAHRRFFEELRYYVEIGKFFFAHAGVRPDVALDQQSARDLLWIRDEFLDSKANLGKIVVHGHSPTKAPVVKANRIGIDTSAYASGHLTVAVLERDQCRFLQT